MLKKAIFGLFLGLLASVCHAGNTPTTRAGILKPAINDLNWGTTLNTDFDIIDASMCVQGGANTFTAVNTFNQPVLIGNSQQLQFYDQSTHYIGFRASNTVTTTNFVWPSIDSSSGSVLQTDGAGNLSFVSPGGASTLLSSNNFWTGNNQFGVFSASSGTFTNYLQVNNGSHLRLFTADGTISTDLANSGSGGISSLDFFGSGAGSSFIFSNGDIFQAGSYKEYFGSNQTTYINNSDGVGNTLYLTGSTNVEIASTTLLLDGSNAKIKLPSLSNTILATDANGVFISTTVSGGGCGAGTCIQNTSSLQSGATFYVSSGTVNGTFIVSSPNPAGGSFPSTTTITMTSPNNSNNNGVINFDALTGTVLPELDIIISSGPYPFAGSASQSLSLKGHTSVGGCGNGLTYGGTCITSSGGTSTFVDKATISNQWAWTSPQPSTFTYGLAVGSLTATGVGNLSVTENGLTGQVVLSTAGTGVTVGHLAAWGSSMTIVDGGAAGGGGTPGGSSGQIQYNNGGVFGGLNSFVTASSVTFFGSSVTFRNLPTTSPNTNTFPGFFDIFDSSPTAVPVGTRLFTLGSSGLVDQVQFIQGQDSIFNYGVDPGGLILGNASTPYTVGTNQSSNNFLDIYDGQGVTGEMSLQTGALATRDIVFLPQTVETVHISSNSMVVKSSMAVTNSNGKYVVAVGTNGVSGLFSLDISTTGHLNSQAVVGATVTACGTAPSFVGSDIAATITTGSGSPTTCNYTFAKPYGNAPTCVASDTIDTAVVQITSVSNATVTMAFSAALNSGKIFLICIGSD
jgi:hypothetical protein